MKAGAQIVSVAVSLAFFECIYNFRRLGQVLYLICKLRMRFERQNLAVDPKATNTVKPAKFEGLEQRLRVV